MIYSYIREKAILIRNEFGDDPVMCAKGLKIRVMPRNNFDYIKGIYTIVGGVSFIFYNSNLPPDEVRSVIAHEIGHHILHRDLAEKTPFREISLYNITENAEREANLFAAEYLISDEDIEPVIREEKSIYELSDELSVSDFYCSLKAKQFVDNKRIIK